MTRNYTIIHPIAGVLWTGPARDGEHAMDLAERHSGIRFDVTAGMSIQNDETGIVDGGAYRADSFDSDDDIDAIGDDYDEPTV